MAFVTGLLLIDAQAAALNNLGNIPGERFENSTGVKLIKTKTETYPYVSAQAYRYWLRTTLEKVNNRWLSSPTYREDKIAYTDANPIKWWDDDLFGYMRAPSKRESAKAKREADSSSTTVTEATDTITRVSPFRVSTLVSITSVRPINDFGVMARHEGDPVPHEHQFYRATLKGLYSLDLNASGTFWYCQKTGFKNLDNVRVSEAEKAQLIHLEGEKAYRLPLEQRIERIAALFEGMAVLDGGAKQALHYTDVTPPAIIFAVTKGGNHIFNYIFGSNNQGAVELKLDALQEALDVFKEEILSDVYIGWAKGYLDSERQKLEAFCQSNSQYNIRSGHPREMFKALVGDLEKPGNSMWFE